MAKAGLWAVTDAEERKRGERTGLDTLVVHAVNGGRWMWGPFHGFRVGANALSIPPGEYGRKAKTQRKLTGARTSGGACGLIRCNAKNLTWA